MDPNEALAQLRAAVVEFKDAEEVAEGLDAARQFVAAFDSLDQWLTLGGFPPAAWNPARLGCSAAVRRQHCRRR